MLISVLISGSFLVETIYVKIPAMLEIARLVLYCQRMSKHVLVKKLILLNFLERRYVPLVWTLSQHVRAFVERNYSVDDNKV